MEVKVDEQMKLLESKINKEFGKNISVKVDWKNTKVSNTNNIKNFLENSILKGLFTDKDSLLNWLKPSKRSMETFLKKISKIEIVVLSDYKQPKKIGSSNYHVEVEHDVLKVVINDGWMNYTDGWGLKVDHELGKIDLNSLTKLVK